MDILFATCLEQPSLTPSDHVVAEALQFHGRQVLIRPWEAIDPGVGTPWLVCLRSTWDYHLKADRFRQWVGRFTAGSHRLWNPPETVLWNLDKIYLLELEALGVPIPRVRYTEPGKPVVPSELFAGTGWSRAVLKPRISASSFRTSLVSSTARPEREEAIDLCAHGAVLQEFVPEIRTRGEVSLMYFGGRYSHAVRKAAAPGEFRVQHNFGGHAQVHEPAAGLRKLADRVLALLTYPWMYVRVDLVESSRGPLLMELELIEPELFFSLVPAAAQQFAQVLLTEASSPRG